MKYWYYTFKSQNGNSSFIEGYSTVKSERYFSIQHAVSFAENFCTETIGHPVKGIIITFFTEICEEQFSELQK